MFRLFVLAMMILSFCLPASSQKRKGIAENRYFPQQVGDEHVYRKTGRLAGENAGWTDKITQKEGSFFLHSDYWGDGIKRWVRTTPAGDVVEQSKSKPALWYRFANPQDMEWVVHLAVEGPPCVDGSRARIVSRNETVE